MKILRSHWIFILLFSSTILVFLYPIIFKHSAFLLGDSLVQFYPWSKVYSEAIKNFRFPYWCRYFHSGFPLMAEGQIGGFYPLNIIMFFIFPFEFAYSYSVVLHFILAGIFTYAYTRRLGADQWGGMLAALLFCFGSAYAGCFCTIVTLKTLVWFPLVLLLLQIFLDTKKITYIIACGIIAGMQFLAGSLQMAAYSLIFYLIYLLYGFRITKIKPKGRILPLVLFIIICFIVAIPQVVLTHHLVKASGRVSASLGFALWKSFPPPCFLSIFFPRWMGFLGSQIFIGVFSILFLIYAIMHYKDSYHIRGLILIGVVSILFALGRYNPLYVVLLKITRFYSFRNPSRFLFFGVFAGSILSGFGFSKFFNQPDGNLIKSAARIFSAILAFSLFIFFVSKFILHLFKDNIILWLQNYVYKYVFGKPYHRYDLQTYMDKVRSIYATLVSGTDLSDIFVLVSVVLVAVGLIAGIIIFIRPYRMKFLRVPVFCIIFLDIFVYSFYGTGFRGNIGPFEHLKPRSSKILKVLKSDQELYRIAPFGLVDEEIPYWVRPNANILYGFDSIAAYTPLAMQDYKEALSPLEVVDDSLGVLSPSNKAIVEKYQLLRLLNMKYVISGRELEYSFMERIVSDEGLFLYKLKDYLPRVFFTSRIDGNIEAEPTGRLEVIEYTSGFVKIRVTTARDGFLVFSENHYPGWKAFVDNTKARILKVKDLVQAVRLSAGTHTVVFKYKPVFIQNKK